LEREQRVDELGTSSAAGEGCVEMIENLVVEVRLAKAGD